jgi:hypothetical protein
VTVADSTIDESLVQLETEEPTLLSWLSNDAKVARVLRANAEATKLTIVRGLQTNTPLDTVLSRVDGLSYRASAALAMRAVQRDRQIRREGG